MIEVEIPSRGIVAEFPDGTPEDQIRKTLQRDYPRNGEDVAFDLATKPEFHRDMGLEDFRDYEQFLETNKTDWLKTAGDAASYAAGVIGKGIASMFANPEKAPGSIVEGAAQGTVGLVDLVTQSQNPRSPLFRFKNLINGDGSDESRLEQFKQARESALRMEKAVSGEEPFVVPQEMQDPAASEFFGLFLDPTLLAPGIGIAGKAGTTATRAAGRGIAIAGDATRAAARPFVAAANAVEGALDNALAGAGIEQSTAQAALRGAGITGAVMGAPGVQPVVAGIAAARTAERAGEYMGDIGQAMQRGESRIGPIEAIGRAPNADGIDRAVGAVGRYGGDAALRGAVDAGTGALTGAGIGAGLGYLSGGEEGAASGLGFGATLGAFGGSLARLVGEVSGAKARERRANDFAAALQQADEPTRTALESVRKRNGLDVAIGLVDGANLLRGAMGDAVVSYVDDAAFKARFGAAARGVQVAAGDRPEVVVNVDRFGRGRGDNPLFTFGHELFHALDSVEQLSDKATAIREAIVGARLVDAGGNVSLVRRGLLDDAEIEARFQEYRRQSPQANELGALGDIVAKADFVGRELASEYMGRLIAGGKPDSLLRGFDGIRGRLLDSSLMLDAGSRLGGIGERLAGLGSAPVESILFSGLKQASPQLRAMMRDLIRARTKLGERMTLADEQVTTISAKDLNQAGVGERLEGAGLAVRNLDGTYRVPTNQESLARTEQVQRAVEDAVAQAPSGPDGARIVDGQVVARAFSPEQMNRIEQARTVPDKVMEVLRAVNSALTGRGANSLLVNYASATEPKKNRKTGKTRPVYSSRARIGVRELVPYEIRTNKENGGLFMLAMDLSRFRAEASKLAESGKLGPYGKDIAGFIADAKRYLSLQANEGTLPGTAAKTFGQDKATFLARFIGPKDKNNNGRFFRNYRLDRTIEVRAGTERFEPTTLGAQRANVNWMPAQKAGNAEVTDSQEGFRMVRKEGGNVRLYKPDGELAGIYKTQVEAEKKAGKLAEKVHGRFMPYGDEKTLTGAGFEIVNYNTMKRGDIVIEIPRFGDAYEVSVAGKYKGEMTAGEIVEMFPPIDKRQEISQNRGQNARQDKESQGAGRVAQSDEGSGGRVKTIGGKNDSGGTTSNLSAAEFRGRLIAAHDALYKTRPPLGRATQADVTKQAAALEDYAEKNGLVFGRGALLGDLRPHKIKGGLEHDVFSWVNGSGRFWKITKDNKYGGQLDTPFDYIDRMERFNALVDGIDVNIEGILPTADLPQIVHSVTGIVGEKPTEAKVNEFLRDNNWTEVAPGQWEHISGVRIQDVHPDNWRELPSGRLVPIDIWVDPFPDEIPQLFNESNKYLDKKAKADA